MKSLEMCHRSPGTTAADDDGVSLVGSIVMNTNEVGFFAFKANSIDKAVKTHKVVVQNAVTFQESWTEQDPKAILAAVHECVANTVVDGQVMGLDVVAVGIANHRGSVVAWNRNTGMPLCNVMLWSDNRTAAAVDRYTRAHGKYRFQGVCGLPFSPLFSAFKIRWLIDYNDRVATACADGTCCFGTVDSWLLWNLTGGPTGGVFATDSTNAAYTFLMNIGTLQWDKTLLRFFGISAGCLPEIRTSSEVYGKIADGPLAGVRVSGVLGNRQAALVGHRCFRRGLAKATLAGSGAAFVVTGPDKVFSGHGLLTTVGYQLDARPVYALEGPIASAGATIEWTKKCLDVRENECSMTAENGRGPLNSVYLVPAFAGLYAPHWRPEARCVLVGVDEYATKDDVLRAAMESACFQANDVLEAMGLDLGAPVQRIRVDGPLSGNRFVMQTLSDLTHARVEAAGGHAEMAALGAAMAAGYAADVNVWAALCMPEDRAAAVYEPRIAAGERADRTFDWKRAVRRTYGWVDPDHDRPGTFANRFWTIVPVAVGALALIVYFVYRK